MTVRRGSDPKLFRTLLSPAVAVVEAFGEPPTTWLFDGEWESVANAAGVRRRDFVGGRACARAALEILGRPAISLPTGADGAPIWPRGSRKHSPPLRRLLGRGSGMGGPDGGHWH